MTTGRRRACLPRSAVVAFSNALLEEPVGLDEELEALPLPPRRRRGPR